MVLQGQVKYFSYCITSYWTWQCGDLTIRNFSPISPKTLWTRGHVKLHDKLKTFHLHYLSTIPMATKPTYNELPSIQLHGSLIAWFGDFSYIICRFKRKYLSHHQLLAGCLLLVRQCSMKSISSLCLSFCLSITKFSQVLIISFFWYCTWW